MMTSRPRPAVQPATQRGFLLIEILVSLVIIAFGLLALAGFVTKATTLAVDTVQRTRASTLLSDMAGRLITNKQLAVAGNYVAATQPATGYGTPSATSTVCADVGVAAVDLCGWHNLLLGARGVAHPRVDRPLRGARRRAYGTVVIQVLITLELFHRCHQVFIEHLIAINRCSTTAAR